MKLQRYKGKCNLKESKGKEIEIKQIKEVKQLILDQAKKISLLSVLERFGDEILQEISSFIIMETIQDDDDFRTIGTANLFDYILF